VDYNKNSIKREVNSDECIHQKYGKTSNKQSNNAPQGLRKAISKPNPKLREGKKQSRLEIPGRNYSALISYFVEERV
jgi:hypothetical protein